MMSKIVLLLAAIVLVAPSVHASSDDTCARSLPTNIDAQDSLRQYLSVMLRQSATFRQQCQRLDSAAVQIQIRTNTQLLDRPYRARSIITRSTTGEVIALVDITPFGNPTEWLAHELEHVIEQLEGVSVARLAAVSTRAAWHTGEDMFETERAMRIGRLVLREVHKADRAMAHASNKVIEVGARGD